MHDETLTELTALINRFSLENKSATPDFILAKYLLGCLAMYDDAMRERTAWYAPPCDSQEPMTNSIRANRPMRPPGD